MKQSLSPFVRIAVDTEPCVTLVRLMGDQRPVRTATLAKLAFALLISTSFTFVIIEARLAPEVSFAEVAGNSNPCGYERREGHIVATRFITSV